MSRLQTTQTNIRLLVVSNLHVVLGDSNMKDSRLQFKNGESEFGSAFIEYAKKLEDRIDILVCTGDISNKADTESFAQGWSFLNEVKSALNISDILCVPGNHDHKSRRTDGVFDPKHHLQFISPPFPFSCSDKNTQFWAWHWCHTSYDKLDFNVLSLNTSAYHGFGDEYEHGRVATEVTDQISSYILSNKFQKKKFNLLICHHHPEKMEYVDKDYDSEAMEGGSYLLRKLSEANQGPWLIIHGHKHFADIVYARSPGSSAATIFSAGSMSAMLYPNIRTRTSNQFYIINVDLIKTDENDRLAGTFETHEWTLANGWHPSTASYLPAKGGFGNTIPSKRIASQISDLIDDGNPFLNQEDLKQFESDLKYFMPNDLDRLIEELKDKGLVVNIEKNEIVEIGKPHDASNT